MSLNNEKALVGCENNNAPQSAAVPSTPWIQSPALSIRLQAGDYRVRTAESSGDFLKVLKLRKEVFYQEILNYGPQIPIDIDYDTYDTYADHIMIESELTGEVIGTYRLIFTEDKSKFYSASQFEFGDFLSSSHKVMELSRACVHPAHRSGQTIQLLWRGIAAYISNKEIDYLMGLTSFWTADREKAKLIGWTFRARGLTFNEHEFRARKDFMFDNHDDFTDVIRNHEILERPPLDKALLPPLALSYIRMGAKFAPVPTLDRNFQCTDFLSFIAVQEMDRKYRNKFLTQ